MDTYEVINALGHLASSLHLDTVASAAVAGAGLVGGLYLARLGIRRRRSAADLAQERPSPVRTADFDGTETLPGEEPAPQDLLHRRQHAGCQRLFQSKCALTVQ